MLAVRTRSRSLSPLFPSAFSMLRALDEASVSLRRGEVTESDDSYTVTVSIPGLSRDDLSLTVTDTTLSLEGTRTVTVPDGFRAVHRERSDFQVRRKLRFSRSIDVDGVTAALADGVLTITLPKSAASRTRQIEIS